MVGATKPSCTHITLPAVAGRHSLSKHAGKAPAVVERRDALKLPQAAGLASLASAAAGARHKLCEVSFVVIRLHKQAKGAVFCWSNAHFGSRADVHMGTIGNQPVRIGAIGPGTIRQWLEAAGWTCWCSCCDTLGFQRPAHG